MKSARARTMPRDYRRPGITNLFAKRNVAAGKVPRDTRSSNKPTDLLAFLKLSDVHAPLHPTDQVIRRNLSAHKITSIAPYLADRRCARWYQHFAPVPSSGLDLLQRRLFSLIERPHQRFPFPSVDDFFTANNTCADHWNSHGHTS